MSSETGFPPEFVQRLVAGDRQAFAEFVDRTSGKLYSLLVGMLSSEQDAEDALQEAYMKALKALPLFEGRSSVYTWLFRIAANEALMLLRKRKSSAVMVEIEEDEEDEGNPLEIVDWCCLPERELLSGETRVHMQKAVDRLSPALRSVFLLRDVEDFSVRETSEILGVNESVVKTRLVRARLKLREDLSGYFKERVRDEAADG